MTHSLLAACLLSLAQAQTPPGAGEEAPAGAPAAGPEEEPHLPVRDVLLPPVLESELALPFPPSEPPVEHTVALQLAIDATGAVTEVAVVSGDAPFDALALEAAAELVFAPAVWRGEPVPVELPFQMTFTPPPVNVSGSLVLAVTQEPLPGVLIAAGEYTDETDDDGYFELRGLPPGEHIVRVLSPTLRARDVSFTLREDQRAELELWARPIGDVIEAVGVYRKRDAEVRIHTIDAEAVRTTPGSMGDPVRATQNLPGAVHTPLEAGWLIVRGGDPSDTGVFIDGIQVPLIYHMGGFNSVVHPGLIDRVEYAPGGGNPRYGRATAGIVDLKTKQLEAETRGEVGIDLINAQGMLQVPVGDAGGLALAFRRSYLDRIIAVVADEETARIAPRFTDWQVLWTGADAAVHALGYNDFIDAPIGDENEVVTFNLGTQRVHGRYGRDLAGGRAKIQPFFASDWWNLEYDEDDESRGSSRAGVRLEYVREIPAPIELEVTGGLDAERGNYDIDINGIALERQFSSADPYLHLEVGDLTRIEPGFRLETLYVEGQPPRRQPSPRVRGQYAIGERLLLLADAGVYHQYPPMDLMIAYFEGPYLEMERSRGAGGGLDLDLGAFGLQTGGFARTMERVTDFEEDGTLGQGEGYAWGSENMVNWSAGRFGGWVSYTYSRSYRREEPEHVWQPYRFDQPHYLVAVTSWQLRRQWVLAARLRAGSGYPWDPDTEEVYDLLSQDIVDLEPNDFLRLQQYNTLDLKLSKQVLFRSWLLDFYLDVQNLYGRRVPEPVITGVIDYGNTWYSFGLPTLPIFGVKGQFQ